MDDNPGTVADQPTREERLAAKLRENLHRRKAQARAMAPKQLAQDIDPGRLPKSPPES